jgi:hypothetical protein
MAKRGEVKKDAVERGQQKIKKVMREYKEGELMSGPEGKGGPVKSREQAVAIALSEARKQGAPIPENPSR